MAEYRLNQGSGTIVSDATPLPVAGGVAAGVAAAGNPIPVGGDFNNTLPTVTTGQRVTGQFTARGLLRVLASATNVAGVDGVNNGNLMTFANETGGASTMFPIGIVGHKYNGASWDRDRKPNAVSRIVSALATTNATVAKASAGDVHMVSGYNAAATVRYLKIYNKATAPTVGTDTPVLTLALAPTSAFNIPLWGQYFATGIAYALTTGSADADTGALTLADVVGLNITYA